MPQRRVRGAPAPEACADSCSSASAACVGRTQNGCVALHYAARCGSVSIATQLLNSGAFHEEKTEVRLLNSVHGCNWGVADCVRAALSCAQNGDTPLQFAVAFGQVAVATLLLDHGAGMDVKDAVRGTCVPTVGSSFASGGCLPCASVLSRAERLVAAARRG